MFEDNESGLDCIRFSFAKTRQYRHSVHFAVSSLRGTLHLPFYLLLVQVVFQQTAQGRGLRLEEGALCAYFVEMEEGLGKLVILLVSTGIEKLNSKVMLYNYALPGLKPLRA